MSEVTIAEKMRRLFSDDVLLQRMLDVEASLAQAEASLGIIPQAAADEIRRKAKRELLDMKKFNEILERTGHRVVAMIGVLKNICESGYGEYIHWGATSQDIVDTANVLRFRDAYWLIFEGLRRIEDNLLNIAETHAHTVMAGRTHGVHALPITFGFKVVGWAREIRRHIDRLKECRERLFVGQLGGAVGTFASFGEKGPEIQRLMLGSLGLKTPDICWHASRDRWAEFANILAMVAGTLGRIANEVILLMSTEIYEVSEWREGQIGSSTMPQKRNPRLSETIVALSKKVRYSASLVTEAMVVSHERDMQFSLVEPVGVAEACVALGDMITFAEALVENLSVNPKEMRRNLDALKGLIMAERVMLFLATKVGRQSAHEIIYEDAMRAMDAGCNFRDILMEDPRVTQHLDVTELDHLLDPESYVGLAPDITKQLVALTRQEREKD